MAPHRCGRGGVVQLCGSTAVGGSAGNSAGAARVASRGTWVRNAQTSPLRAHAVKAR